MNEIIDFYFAQFTKLWSVITAQWILSYAVLITLLFWIVSLINNSRQK